MKYIFILGLFSSIVLKSLVISKQISKKEQRPLEQKVDADGKTDGDTNKTKVSRLPDLLLPVIPISNSVNISLQLVKHGEVLENVNVFISGGKNKSKIVEDDDIDGEKEFSTYTDVRYSASFTVALNITKRVVSYSYYGSFQYGNKSYTIFPEDNPKEPITENDQHVNVNGTKYILKENVQIIINNSVEVDGTGDYVIPDDGCNKTNEYKTDSALAQRSGPGEYTVELFVVIDFSIFKKWLDHNRDDENKAIESIRYYFAHIINGVNDRYKTLLPSLNMGFKLAGYYVAKTARDSQFLESLRSGNSIDGDSGLKAFKGWIGEKGGSGRSGLPKYDIAAVYTSYDMASVLGIAYLGAVCTLTGVGIVKDFGQFGTIDTTAHELGHSLGAEHDGGFNGCSESDQYIMTPVRGVNSGQLLQNSHRFSKCSLKNFQDHIGKMDRQNSNCLLNAATHSDPNLESFLNEYPGQKFSADQQCQFLYGPSSKFCKIDQNSLNKICEKMYCSTEGSQCSVHSNQRGADGTPCGKGLWCYNAQCVTAKPKPGTSYPNPPPNNDDNNIGGGGGGGGGGYDDYNNNGYKPGGGGGGGGGGCKDTSSFCSVLATSAFSCNAITVQQMCCASCQRLLAGK